MDTKPNQPDTAIDKTLAALKNATPPEGMEARIAHRLAQPAPAVSHWRDIFTGYSLPAAWWRGATTGAAAALLAVAAVFLLQHAAHKVPHTQTAVTANAPVPGAIPVKFGGTPATPCAHPAILRAVRPVSTPSPALLLAEAGTESAAPSRPAPVLPLTAQERALARLARTADPQQLIALSSEPKIKPDAENAAASTPPPAPPAPEDQPAASPPANPEPPSAATPEPSPAANPEPAPEAAPEPESANPESSPALN